MPGDRLRRVIAARDDHDRDVGKNRHAGDDGGHILQGAKVLGHRSKAFRLAPDRLHDRVYLGRQLPDFAHQPLQRPRRRRSEDPDKTPRDTRSAVGQKGETASDNADSRQEAADA